MVRVPTTLSFRTDWLPHGRPLVASGPEALRLRRAADGSRLTHAERRNSITHPWN
jgi:hypothetical protein